jgi:hypothetical protein
MPTQCARGLLEAVPVSYVIVDKLRYQTFRVVTPVRG